MTHDWPIAFPADWAPAPPIDTTGFVKFDEGHAPPGTMVVEGEWAGIRRVAEGASSGPTGMPWVDSNGWKIRLLRAQNPDKRIWVESKAPEPAEVIRVERYLSGMADAAAHGGHWVLKLDAAFTKSLAAKDADALGKWDKIAQAAKYFRAHTSEDSLPARAVTAVISDFSGDNELLGQEILNLAARQQFPYLIIDKGRFQGLPSGLIAAVYPDEQPPADALRTALLGFVRGGGMLIAGASWGTPKTTPLPDSASVRYRIHIEGQGRIAIAGDGDMADPYLVAADTQVLVSHRNDIVRMWNGGSMGVYPTGDRRRSVVHFINYSGRAGGDPVSVWVAGDFGKATLRSFEFTGTRPLEILRRRNGVEVHLPPVAVYAALEVSS
ncbi:MAG: hypothetical protein JNL98_23320 [Bryobacterales bacterium]|nr:hypothetical protein [Bryobacterales bacterium]